MEIKDIPTLAEDKMSVVEARRKELTIDFNPYEKITITRQSMQVVPRFSAGDTPLHVLHRGSGYMTRFGNPPAVNHL